MIGNDFQIKQWLPPQEITFIEVNILEKCVYVAPYFWQCTSVPASPPLLKRSFRVDEVAAYFMISTHTVYRLLDEGDLQATRFRGCAQVSAEEIRRFEETLEEGTAY